jgi:drug/metabolite transporter (DMT)-like permease
VFQVTFALVIVSVLAMVLERPWETAHPDAGAWFSVVWLGIFGSGLAYVLYFRLLGRWGATRTALVAYLLPVYGIVLGFLVLRERVDVTLILGTALVIAGVALVNSPWGQRRLFEPATTVPPVETA